MLRDYSDDYTEKEIDTSIIANVTISNNSYNPDNNINVYINNNNFSFDKIF